MLKNILVYGSLKRGRENNQLLARDAEFVETVRLPGFDLFKVGWYPGIRPNPANAEGVECELYTITGDAALPRLDNYEGYLEGEPEHSLFVRKEVTVNGVSAYVYEYNRETRPDNIVPSGQW